MEKRFEYVIKIEGKEVWKGLNPTRAYAEIKNRTLGKKFRLRGELKKSLGMYMGLEFPYREEESDIFEEGEKAESKDQNIF